MVVDESRSMDNEHNWTPGMVHDLEMTLKNIGIGVCPSLPNLFGIVGFGRGLNARPYGSLAHTFTSRDGRKMLPINDLAQVTAQVQSDSTGSYEDGYQAIEHALNDIDFRTNQNVGRLMILISDEDRDNIRRSLSRQRIKDLLMKRKMTLHVVVDNTFSAKGRTAFGVNSTEWAFLQGDNGTVIAAPGAQLGLGFANTLRQYTELALELNGTAWDINLLRRGRKTTQTMTYAFTRVVANGIHHLRAKNKVKAYESEINKYQCVQVNCLVL